MKRTNIYVDEEVLEWFKGYARERRRTVSDVVREAMERFTNYGEVYEKLSLGEVEESLRGSGKYSEEFIRSVMEGLRKSSVYGGE